MTEDNNYDMFTKLIQRSEQLEAHFPVWSRLIAAYYRSLIEAGLPPEVAEKLIIRWYEKVFLNF